MDTAKLRSTRIFWHVCIWALLVGIPLLGTSVDSSTFFVKFKLIYTGIIGMLFYFNYSYLVPRFYFNKKLVAFTLINLAIIATIVIVQYMLKDFIQALINSHLADVVAGYADQSQATALYELMQNEGASIHPSTVSISYKSAIMQVLAIGAAIGIRGVQRLHQEETRRIAAEKEQLRSEVLSLKYQLQPHFFFNSLNSIYSLIDTDSEKAKQAIHQMGKLMRYVLYRSQESTVLVSEEFNFLTSFAEVMKARYADDVAITIDLKADLSNSSIPPLLLICLVENAFKHGVGGKEKNSIEISSSLNDGFLVLRVVNDIVTNLALDESGSGIGLTNLSKRLEILYPENNYSLETTASNAVFTAVLKLPMS